MNCVSCGAVLEHDASYCTVCGAYQPKTSRLFTDIPVPEAPPVREPAPSAALSLKTLFGKLKKRPTYRCETMQSIDRFAEHTPVTLQLNDEEQRLLIIKGSAQISLPYRQILDFSVRRTEAQEKNLLDLLQSMVGLNRRWIATLTYQTLEGGIIKHLHFLELEEDGYYREENMSGRAKRFEKELGKIIQHYHPYGQLD